MFCIFLPLMGSFLRKSVSHFPMGKPPTVEMHKWTIQSTELKQDTQGHWKVLNSVWEDGGRGGYETNMNTCDTERGGKVKTKRRPYSGQYKVWNTPSSNLSNDGNRTQNVHSTEQKVSSITFFFLHFFLRAVGGDFKFLFCLCTSYCSETCSLLFWTEETEKFKCLLTYCVTDVLVTTKAADSYTVSMHHYFQAKW